MSVKINLLCIKQRGTMKCHNSCLSGLVQGRMSYPCNILFPSCWTSSSSSTSRIKLLACSSYIVLFCPMFLSPSVLRLVLTEQIRGVSLFGKSFQILRSFTVIVSCNCNSQFLLNIFITFMISHSLSYDLSDEMHLCRVHSSWLFYL